ncbi:hypothetical protein LTR36_002557 [Oleoguttula mirabilis]|uniref:Uncharacterized protein n=1 Tax=Oleoguttula mirabilis TaxID=1507867 RepID=A0AAV9JM57_9PEZI|nr:hypothetical protein LTR36_002557 [Oleoguttula mirabilis]
MTSFIDLPVELRNRIYMYALVLPFLIANDSVERTNLNARHPDWYRRDRLTACFNFLRTCVTVYNEASRMFWGCNTFLLCLEPVDGHVRDLEADFRRQMQGPTETRTWTVKSDDSEGAVEDLVR